MRGATRSPTTNRGARPTSRRLPGSPPCFGDLGVLPGFATAPPGSGAETAPLAICSTRSRISAECRSIAAQARLRARRGDARSIRPAGNAPAAGSRSHSATHRSHRSVRRPATPSYGFHAPFPHGVKYRFVVLAGHRPERLHATEVMLSIHRCVPHDASRSTSARKSTLPRQVTESVAPHTKPHPGNRLPRPGRGLPPAPGRRRTAGPSRGRPCP
jgi:hypothetical protein